MATKISFYKNMVLGEDSLIFNEEAGEVIISTGTLEKDGGFVKSYEEFESLAKTVEVPSLSNEKFRELRSKWGKAVRDTRDDSDSEPAPVAVPVSEPTPASAPAAAPVTVS